jgi:hypothetical protein
MDLVYYYLKMPRFKKSSPNPAYTLTAEKYALMLNHYITTENPTVKSLMEASGVGRIVAKRALTLGWPELNLPPLIDAAKNLIDPVEVHKQMASMHDKRKEIEENLFGPVTKTDEAPIEAVSEANRRLAESGMAARIALSTAVKSARVVEKFVDKVAELINQGEIELPEKISLQHLFMITKAADTAAGAIHKATQTERLSLGEPDNVAGAHVAAILIGATAEELKQVALGHGIPPRLLGIAPKDKIIDVEPNTSADASITTLEDHEDPMSAESQAPAGVTETVTET